MFRRIINTDNAPTTLIIRLIVGGIFLSEGVQKFIFADKLGSGRFAKIGLPSPEFLGPFVGVLEIVCGTLVLIGLFTRLAVIPLLAIMLVAIALTKAVLLGESGFWLMLHESRTDWAVLLGSLFLLIKGGGKWSFDQSIQQWK